MMLKKILVNLLAIISILLSSNVIYADDSQVDLTGDYWFCDFGISDHYSFKASGGEVLIDGTTLEVVDYTNPSESGTLIIESAAKNDAGWLSLKIESEDSSETFSYTNTLLNNISFGETNDDSVRTLILISKADNPTEEDIIGNYTSYGHWVWSGNYYSFGSEAHYGTVTISSSKINATTKVTQIDSGPETERHNNLPWHVNSSESTMTVETGEDDLDLYVCKGGVVLEVSGDDGDDAGYGIYIKNSSGKKISDMVGTWLLQEFTTDEYGYGIYTTRGTVEIDSKGNYTAATSYFDGESEVPIGQDTGKVTISSNGNFKAKSSITKNTLQGTINIDDNIFAYSVFDNDGEVGIGIATKVEDEDNTDEPLTNETLPIGLELSRAGIPSTVFAGDSAKVQLSLKVGNSGSQDFPVNAEVEVLIYADNGQEGSEPVLLDSTIYNVGKLKPGKTKSLNVKLDTPDNLATGDYIFSAVCNDDVVTSEGFGTMAVEEPYTGFNIAIASVRVPDEVIAGEKIRGTAKVSLTNIGNMTTEKSLVSNIKVIARETGSGSEYVVGQAELKAGNMKPGRFKQTNIKIEVPEEVAEGTYELLVSADTPVIGNELPSNELKSTGEELDIIAPYIDLQAGIPTFRFDNYIEAGKEPKIRVPVSISNSGNIATSKNQQIDINLYLRLIEPYNNSMLYYDENETYDFSAGEIKDYKIRNLKPGKTKKLKLKLEIPGGLFEGEYALVVKIKSSSSDSGQEIIYDEYIYNDSISYDDGWTNASSILITASESKSSISGRLYECSCEGNLYGVDFDNDNYYAAMDPDEGLIDFTILQADEQEALHEVASQMYYWEDKNDGLYLNEYGLDIAMGTLDFDFDDLIVFEQTGEGSTSELSGSVSIILDESTYTADVTGTASANGKNLGVKAIEVNDKNQEASTTAITLTITASGIIDGKMVNINIFQDIIYYSDQSTGIVKDITETEIYVSIEGIGRKSASAKETREISAWAMQ